MTKNGTAPNPIGVAEASEITGLDRRTIHRMIQRGELAAIAKFPGLRGSYVLDRSDIQRLVDERLKGSAA